MSSVLFAREYFAARSIITQKVIGTARRLEAAAGEAIKRSPRLLSALAKTDAFVADSPRLQGALFETTNLIGVATQGRWEVIREEATDESDSGPLTGLQVSHDRDRYFVGVSKMKGLGLKVVLEKPEQRPFPRCSLAEFLSATVQFTLLLKPAIPPISYSQRHSL